MSRRILVLGVILVLSGSLMLRNDFESLVESWLPGDEAGLASGILLGGSDKLSRPAKEAFRKVGMLHVVAASGYNVTVVAGVVMGIFVKLVSRRWTILFVIVSVVLYMYLAGMMASVVRAGVMAILTYVALLLGRQADGYWTLGLVALVMILVRPEYVSDIGFLLSVAATVGVLFSHVIPIESERRVEDARPRTASLDLLRALGMTIKSDLKTTLWAQVFTVPIILHYFGDLSLISPLANATLLWTVPIVMQIMLLALLIGVVWPVLGQLVSYLAYPFLRLLNVGAEMFSGLPFASVNVGKMSWVWVGAYYVLLLIILNVKSLLSNRWRSIS